MTPADNRPLLAVCCPGPSFSWMWTNAWSMFLPRLLEQHQVCLEFCTSCNIHVARNRAVSDVLKATDGHDLNLVLWIDSDNLFDYDQFLLLKQALEDHPELAGVGANYYVQSGIPAGAEIAAGWFTGDAHVTDQQIKEAGDTPIEVDYLGFGMLLMRGDVIKMEPNPFNPILHGDSFHGDDASFCLRAKQHGLRFAVHPKVHIPHLKLLGITPAT